MLAERAALRRIPIAKAERARLAEIKMAFREGAAAGADFIEPGRAWERSFARRRFDFPLRQPGDAIRQWKHEQMLRPEPHGDDAYAERWWRRRDEVKAAFAEGHAVGVGGFEAREAWLYSATRGALYLGPPTPLHLRRSPFNPYVAPGER